MADTFSFPATVAGLLQREALAAGLLTVGRKVRFFRSTVGLVTILHLEAGNRQGLGQIAAAVKGTR
jgi:hypothetical protein